MDKNGLDNFTLKLRLSSVKGTKRWDKDFVQNELQKIPDLQKVYVCGPPIMQQGFEFLDEIAKVCNLDFKTQVDIM